MKRLAPRRKKENMNGRKKTNLHVGGEGCQLRRMEEGNENQRTVSKTFIVAGRRFSWERSKGEEVEKDRFTIYHPPLFHYSWFVCLPVGPA